MPEYLAMSNIVQRILTLESQLGLDPRLENPVYVPGLPSPSKDQYLDGFIASEKGVVNMQEVFSDYKDAYFSKYINWKAFVDDATQALHLAKKIDQKCPFRFSEETDTSTGGIGQGFLLIVFGHWNNLLAASGLLGDGTTLDVFGIVTGVANGPYYLNPTQGSGEGNELTYFEQAVEILKNNNIPGSTVNAPIYTAFSTFLPIYGGYNYINAILGEVINGWLSEDKKFYVPQIN